MAKIYGVFRDFLQILRSRFKTKYLMLVPPDQYTFHRFAASSACLLQTANSDILSVAAGLLVLFHTGQFGEFCGSLQFLLFFYFCDLNNTHIVEDSGFLFSPVIEYIYFFTVRLGLRVSLIGPGEILETQMLLLLKEVSVLKGHPYFLGDFFYCIP